MDSNDSSSCAMDSFPGDFFTQAQRLQGGILVHFFITIYACAMMVIVCEDYFIPALEIVCKYLRMSPDLAGLTLMSLGSSTSALFSSFIGAFITQNDIGLGMVVGSAIFNILAVTCVSTLSLGTKKKVPLDWYPVTRDCIAYLLTVAMLIWIVFDQVVTWWESALLLVMYAAYVAFVAVSKERPFNQNSDETDWTPTRPFSRKAVRFVYTSNADVTDSSAMDSPEEMSPWHPPPAEDGKARRVWWAVMWPAYLILYLSIPDCRRHVKLAGLTFCLCLIWMGIISYLCVWMVTVIGDTLSIPEDIAGITILAAGVCVPEIIFGVINIRKGRGNLILSTQMGSNIFDILICMGLPWFILCLYQGGEAPVPTSAMSYTTLGLLASVVLFWLLLLTARWTLDWKVGLACGAFYLLFLVVTSLYYMNVFGGFDDDEGGCFSSSS